MSAGLLDSARSVLAGLISLGHARFELFGVELREELVRLATLLLGGLAVLILALLAIAFAAFALVIAVQAEQRLLAASLVAGGFAAAAGLVAWAVLRFARAKRRAFEGTLSELARDLQAIRP